jgi:DNA-binding GntR family transcriptional regulator
MIIREPVRATVKSRVYQWILEGDAMPGQPLNLSDAASRLGVSVTPIREALIELEAEGLVRTEMGRGFIVQPLSVEEVEELYPLIWTLEATALRAMPRPSEERLAELERVNENLVREGDDPERAVFLDNQWHELLLREAPGQITREILGMLKRRAFRYEFKYMTATGGRPSTEQHRAVVEALREDRREAAVAALEENWRTGPRLLVPWLQKGEARASVPR